MHPFLAISIVISHCHLLSDILLKPLNYSPCFHDCPNSLTSFPKIYSLQNSQNNLFQLEISSFYFLVHYPIGSHVKLHTIQMCYQIFEDTTWSDHYLTLHLHVLSINVLLSFFCPSNMPKSFKFHATVLIFSDRNSLLPNLPTAVS